MCFICDGGTSDELDEQVAFHIQDPGWFTMAVGDMPIVDWAYTIGLSERFEHAELVTTGPSCAHCVATTINDLGGRIAAGEKFVVDDHLWLPAGGQVRFGPVHPDHWYTDRFAQWKRYYAPRYPDVPERTALQVIWLDDRGRWQDDPTNPRWRHEDLARQPRGQRRPRHRRR